MKTEAKRSAVVLVAALLIGAALGAVIVDPAGRAYAQAPSPVASDLPRTITVVGEGTVALEPDVAQAQIGVDVAGDNVKDASADAAKTMDAILAALQAEGVAKKDIQTTNYSIYAERGADALGRPTGEMTYRVNNGVTVTIRDLATVGAVLDAVIDAGANNIYGVTFGVSSPDAVMAEARAKATEDARARAEELAALHGVALGDVISISEVVGGSVPMLQSVNAVMGFAGGGGAAVQPGEMKMSTQLQVVYKIAGPAGAAEASEQASAEAPAASAAASAPGAAEATRASSAPSSMPAGSATATPTLVTFGETVLAPLTATARQGTVTIEGNETLLRPFVERWFRAASGDRPVDTTILLGRLPDDLPFELPIPTGATVESSVIEFSQAPGEGYGPQISLTAPLESSQVRDFFAEQLAELGFEPLAIPANSASVFIMPQRETTFCNEDSELAVNVTATPLDGDTQRSEVSIGINPIENSPCVASGSDRSAMADRLLPRLEPPAGVSIGSGVSGGGSGPDEAYASALLTTDLSPSKVAEHYGRQLQEAGWKATRQAETDGVSWSVWQFDDDNGWPWVGTLLVAERPAQEKGLFVQVQIDRQR